MTDVSRGGFAVRTVDQADEISRRFGAEAEILDEGWNVTPDGYFDRKILVRTPNGIISEIQIWSPEVLKTKKSIGHDLYKRRRATEDPELAEDLRDQMRAAYRDALAREDQSFQDLVGISKLPNVPANADLNEASSGITRPVLETSAASTETQLPPGSRMATASVAEREMAGRPSQLTNIIDDTSTADIDIGSRPVNPDRLFDDIETDQLMEGIDLDEEISLEVAVDPQSGEPAVATVTMRDVKRMVDEEDAIIQRLEFCTR
jgi:hypothetical protein